MRTPALLTVALAASWLSGSAFAEADPAAELKQAEEALAAGKYEQAFKEYRRKAESGNPLAQFSLGLFYRNGWGRPEDPEAACAWFKKAAEAKIPTAAHFYAESLEHGTGCPADSAMAAVWYRKAAELGHHGSLCSLADLYMTGRGVEKDPRQALELCRRAAAHRAHGATIQLGRYLLEGDETIRNEQEALASFQIAAQQQSGEGQYYLGTMLRDGRGCPKDPAAARNWLEAAASQGHLPAYLPTAELYLHAPPDPKTGRLSADHLAKAYLWLRGTEARSADKEQLARAWKMLKEVRTVMPKTWEADLDAKVAEHLAKFSKSSDPHSHEPDHRH